MAVSDGVSKFANDVYGVIKNPGRHFFIWLVLLVFTIARVCLTSINESKRYRFNSAVSIYTVSAVTEKIDREAQGDLAMYLIHKKYDMGCFGGADITQFEHGRNNGDIVQLLKEQWLNNKSPRSICTCIDELYALALTSCASNPCMLSIL
jgi:hypothetical protein